MNERILELAKQSLPAFYLTNCPSALEKFAELIVKECFKAALIETKGHVNPVDLMKRMEERVGVKL